MSDQKVTSKDGSTAIGGDVNAPVLNLNLTAPHASSVNLSIEQHTEMELPSHLGAVIVAFSRQSLSEYGRGLRRALPAEVTDKVAYNNLSTDHRALVDYYRHSLVLERAYLGVEQQNSDARYLVRRKTAIAYNLEIQNGLGLNVITTSQKLNYVRTNADRIIERVITRLVDDYRKSSGVKVEQETAHLAVSLVVIDSVVECEVLERPANALTA